MPKVWPRYAEGVLWWPYAPHTNSCCGVGGGCGTINDHPPQTTTHTTSSVGLGYMDARECLGHTLGIPWA